jgi:hypothetical protein
MFVPFKRPLKGQCIQLNKDITNQRGTFVAPHQFEVKYDSDDACELHDREGNRVFGVLNIDIRDQFHVISKTDYDNGILIV